MTNTNLIPAANFAVEKVDTLIRIDARRSVAIKGFGVRDLSADGLVSFNSRVEGVLVPTVYPNRSTAEALKSQGLFAGYGVV